VARIRGEKGFGQRKKGSNNLHTKSLIIFQEDIVKKREKGKTSIIFVNCLIRGSLKSYKEKSWEKVKDRNDEGRLRCRLGENEGKREEGKKSQGLPHSTLSERNRLSAASNSTGKKVLLGFLMGREKDGKGVVIAARRPEGSKKTR